MPPPLEESTRSPYVRGTMGRLSQLNDLITSTGEKHLTNYLETYTRPKVGGHIELASGNERRERERETFVSRAGTVHPRNRPFLLYNLLFLVYLHVYLTHM